MAGPRLQRGGPLPPPPAMPTGASLRQRGHDTGEIMLERTHRSRKRVALGLGEYNTAEGGNGLGLMHWVRQLRPSHTRTGAVRP